MADRIDVDDRGFPVVLADVPGSGVSRVAPDQVSGNPRHDTRSGKFGAGGAPENTPGPKQRPAQGPSAPPNVDPVEWGRYVDAVRTAAREFDTPALGDIQDFLRGYAKDPSKIDPNEFLKAVQEQRISDLVDVLDSQLRTSGLLQRNRPRVRVVAPRGFVKKLIGSMEAPQLAEVQHRLESLGHDPTEVDKFFKGRVPQDQHAALDQHRQAIAASDMWHADPLDGESFEGLDERDLSADWEKRVAAAVAPPQVNVTVPVVVAQGKRTVKRNAETGLIEEIEDATGRRIVKRDPKTGLIESVEDAS